MDICLHGLYSPWFRAQQSLCSIVYFKLSLHIRMEEGGSSGNRVRSDSRHCSAMKKKNTLESKRLWNAWTKRVTYRGHMSKNWIDKTYQFACNQEKMRMYLYLYNSLAVREGVTEMGRRKISTSKRQRVCAVAE